MPYIIKETETTVPAMAYTNMRLIWGKLVAPKVVRVPTWLKMTMVPELMTFVEAEMLVFGGGQPARLSAPEIHIPSAQILAFHVLPPTQFEPDYDPNEPNRTMKPVSALCNIYRFDGKRRLSTLGDFVSVVQASKETYAGLYDVTISHPTVPGLKAITVPFVMLRADATAYIVQS